MRNAASYQEGYTDGFTDGKVMQKKEIIRSLYDFIREQKTEEPDRPYLRGYNSCLTDLKDFIEENLI